MLQEGRSVREGGEGRNEELMLRGERERKEKVAELFGPAENNSALV